ncbi:MAG TPA: OmpA family protein [Myxococcota bacterium]|nr:OmpA family protein [Myxococcota bacterium]
MKTRTARRNHGRWGASLLVGAGLVLAMAAAASAGPREATLELLQSLASGLEGEGGADFVRVSVNDGSQRPLRIGEELVYRFEAGRPGYLTAIHVDFHGALTLLYPRARAEDGRVDAGQPIQLPGPDDGFTLEAQPPIGREVVYAIVTDEPIHRRDLGIRSDEMVVSFEPQQAPAFARTLRSVVSSRVRGRARVARVDQQIDGRGAVLYRSADIVQFFGERTRSIAPPKLDLQVHFETDSAELDEDARRNIDEFAAALSDPKLRATRFAVAGHTDERGPDDHNLDLSRRRAARVRDYLIEQGGIEASRLELEAHGEGNPLMEEVSDYARRMNRRVEFSPIR